MNKLKTSTKVLILLAVTAIIVAAVLFFTMPEPLAQKISDRYSLVMDGSFDHFDKSSPAEGYQNYRGRFGFPGFGRAHGFPGGIVLLALIGLFIFGRRRIHRKGNHSRAIIDSLYAEEKISEKEYHRRKTVLEEGEK